MNPKKVRKLRRRLGELRRGTGNMPSRKLERFARSLGRHRSKSGSEPTWISDILPKNTPISIPHHSRNLNKYTADGILDQLEKDLIDLETMSQTQEKEELT